MRILEVEVDPEHDVDDIWNLPNENNNVDAWTMFRVEEGEDEIPEMADHDDVPDYFFQNLLRAEVMLPNNKDDGHIRGIVLKQAKNNLGNPIGRPHQNP